MIQECLEQQESTVTRYVGSNNFHVSLSQHYRYPGVKTEADPEWQHTDAAGHVHRYEREYDGGWATPTLIKRTRTVHDEYEGDSWEETYLACLECGEEIEPGRRRVHQPMIAHGFSGEYAGRVPAELLPTTGCQEIELGNYIPGITGKARLISVNIEMVTDLKLKVLRMKFMGNGALAGFDEVGFGVER